MNQLDRHFASQVEAMKETGYPLEGLITHAPNGKTLDFEERTLTRACVYHMLNEWALHLHNCSSLGSLTYIQIRGSAHVLITQTNLYKL